MSGVQDKFRGSYRGSLVMRDQLIVFSMKREFILRNPTCRFCVAREELD